MAARGLGDGPVGCLLSPSPPPLSLVNERMCTCIAHMLLYLGFLFHEFIFEAIKLAVSLIMRQVVGVPQSYQLKLGLIDPRPGGAALCFTSAGECLSAACSSSMYVLVRPPVSLGIPAESTPARRYVSIVMHNCQIQLTDGSMVWARVRNDRVLIVVPSE